MWMIIMMRDLRGPNIHRIINEAVRLAKKAVDKPPFLVSRLGNLAFATQNPDGESLAAQVVKSGELHHSQIIWVFRPTEKGRIWLFFIGLDLANKIVYIGAPRDQQKILNLLVHSKQQELF